MFVQHNVHVPILETGGAAGLKMEEQHNLAEKGQHQPMEVDSEPLPGPSTPSPTTTLHVEKRSKFSPAALKMLEAIWGFESLSGFHTRIVRVHPSASLVASPPSTHSTGPPTAGPSRESSNIAAAERQ
jgi:hypothetical protein